MSSLINPSFFHTGISVPNIGNPMVNERVQGFINLYEPECLRLLFGSRLAEAFIASPQDARMVDLISGANYQSQYNNTLKWNGLIEPNNISLIAFYVYYYMMKDMASETTGIGEKIVEVENTQTVSNGPQTTYR